MNKVKLSKFLSIFTIPFIIFSTSFSSIAANNETNSSISLKRNDILNIDTSSYTTSSSFRWTYFKETLDGRHDGNIPISKISDPVFCSMNLPSESRSDYMIKCQRDNAQMIGKSNNPNASKLVSIGAIYQTSGEQLPANFSVYFGKIDLFAYSKSHENWIKIDTQPYPCDFYIYSIPWTAEKARHCQNVTKAGTYAKVDLQASDLDSSVVHFWGKKVDMNKDDYVYYAAAYDFWVDQSAASKITAMGGIDLKGSTGTTTIVQLFSTRGLSGATTRKTQWGHDVPNSEYDKYNTSILNQLHESSLSEIIVPQKNDNNKDTTSGSNQKSEENKDNSSSSSNESKDNESKSQNDNEVPSANNYSSTSNTTPPKANNNKNNTSELSTGSNAQSNEDSDEVTEYPNSIGEHNSPAPSESNKEDNDIDPASDIKDRKINNEVETSDSIDNNNQEDTHEALTNYSNDNEKNGNSDESLQNSLSDEPHYDVEDIISLPSSDILPEDSLSNASLEESLVSSKNVSLDNTSDYELMDDQNHTYDKYISNENNNNNDDEIIPSTIPYSDYAKDITNNTKQNNNYDIYNHKPADIIDNTLKNTNISSIVNGKKSITIKWKKQPVDTKGYQIQCSTDKHFENSTKTITVKKNHSTSKTIKKLKSGKKYYIRMRTYKEVDGKKVYSKWSKTKKVKIEY